MKSKGITVTHIVATSILWLLGVMSFAFNLFGLWQLWHLAMYAFVGISWIVVILGLVAWGTTHTETDADIRKRYHRKNVICFLLNVFIVAFTLLVSNGWGLARFIYG